MAELTPNVNPNEVLARIHQLVQEYIIIWSYKEASDNAKAEAKNLLYQYINFLVDIDVDGSVIAVQDEINCQLKTAGIPELFWQWRPKES